MLYKDVQMMTLGRSDKAWTVMVSALLHSPDKIFWACLWVLSPNMPRRPDNIELTVQFNTKTPMNFRSTLLSSRRIAPGTTVEGYLYILLGFSQCKIAIAGLFLDPTTATSLTC